MTLTLKPALKYPLLGQASVPALMNPQVSGRISMPGQGVMLSCLLASRPEYFLILLARLCPGPLRGQLMRMELQGCGQHCVKLCLEQER